MATDLDLDADDRESLTEIRHRERHRSRLDMADRLRELLDGLGVDSDPPPAMSNPADELVPMH